MVKIGDIEVGEFPLLLAPMEDVSDPPFRALCKEQGADVVFTEFISSEGLIRDAAKSVQKLDIYEKERPVGIQIFGAEMDSMLQTTDIVTLVSTEGLGNLNYKIYDSTGQFISNGFGNKISLKNLDSGLYFIIINNNSFTTSHKVIKY